MQIYNTLTRKKEDLIPLEAGRVKMYACGITVYDFCHLGHARALLTYDIIARYLKYKGYQVLFVRNITDIDDKIINRANERGIDYRDLTKQYIGYFYEDTNTLGLLRPDHEPRATDCIAEIIALVQGLIDKDLAYNVHGDVFYAVRKFKGYGKLSGKNIEELSSGARVDVNEAKRDPLDFALWKAAKLNEPSWDSPWGKGRPGWHIECSAMSMKYLSATFDIHGGGRDLIFPHHENEIAQSEGFTDKPFARYWFHNGFVNINTEKMSKSLGNFKTIRDILQKFPAEVVRFFILSSHYRSPLDYTDQNIFDAVTSLERYYETKKRLKDYCAQGLDPASPEKLGDKIAAFKNDFITSMDDDFNTAKVVGAVFEWVRVWNKLLDEGRALCDDIRVFFNVIEEIHQTLGMFGSDPDVFLTELKNKRVTQTAVSPESIEGLIAERQGARKGKNFKRSDEIRDELLKNGIVLKDHPDGTTSWTVKG
ncbi:MAG: cysteine--tRNA ligase [Deltaproteobacteria bacterium]|nr:cysteine--tRNA ligase [Deltaproteobacteria bacterium]